MSDENCENQVVDHTMNVVLRKPESFASGERATVSLHLLVKNGESCVPRLLMNLGPYLDEVVAVVNDTTDNTIRELESFAKEQVAARSAEGRPEFKLKVVEVTSGSHPHFYIMDEPETYARGKPMVDEVMEGPFTGKPILADWAGVRNLGWAECTSDFILFLDADDELLDPQAIPGLCALMNERSIDLVATRYRFAVDGEGRTYSESFRERLVRNHVGIHWEEVTHEVLRGARRTSYVDGNLVVVDHKDSLGADVRVPGRCLKVLYHHGRTLGWNVGARTFLYLGQEARTCMPDLALAALERYLDLSVWAEERAWACSMAGEIHESAERYSEASSWYERALCEYPGSKSAYRLCRSRFAEKKWYDVVSAYEVGAANEAVMQVLDSGPAFRDMSKILVAAAYDQLASEEEDVEKATRRKIAAWLAATDALLSFPENSALRLLRDQVEGSMDKAAGLALVGEMLKDDPDNQMIAQLSSQIATSGGGSAES